MPIYEYRCDTCGQRFDEFQPMGAKAPPCPGCGTEGAERLMSLVARGAGASAGCGPGCCGGTCGTRAN